MVEIEGQRWYVFGNEKDEKIVAIFCSDDILLMVDE
jgi:hypothetical protein